MFLAARDHVASWVESVRTPARVPSAVNPLPHPMQVLASNTSNTTNPINWKSSLFNNIVEEGLNLAQHEITKNDEEVRITVEDISPEIEYWRYVVVCYILGMRPPYRMIDGFIRRMWKKFGVVKVAMMENGMFIVRFHSIASKNKAMEAGPILYDGKPVIVKEWHPDIDVNGGNVKVVPTLDQGAKITSEVLGFSGIKQDYRFSREAYKN